MQQPQLTQPASQLVRERDRPLEPLPARQHLDHPPGLVQYNSQIHHTELLPSAQSQFVCRHTCEKMAGLAAKGIGSMGRSMPLNVARETVNVNGFPVETTGGYIKRLARGDQSHWDR